MSMELMEAIVGKRIIPRYKDTPVPFELIKEAQEAMAAVTLDYLVGGAGAQEDAPR